jgi:hypothetical protein
MNMISRRGFFAALAGLVALPWLKLAAPKVYTLRPVTMWDVHDYRVEWTGDPLMADTDAWFLVSTPADRGAWRGVCHPSRVADMPSVFKGQSWPRA